MRAHPVGLPTLLARWVDEGLLTAEQAERILTSERNDADRPPAVAPVPPVPRTRVWRPSLVVEALAYLGGVLVLVAAGILTGRLWSDLSLAARLAIAGTAAAAPLVAGAVGGADDGGRRSRLRAVLWLGSAGGAAAFLGVLAVDGLDWTEEDVALFVSVGTAVYTGMLWRLDRHLLLQAGLLVAVSSAAASATVKLEGGPDVLPGLAVVGVGVAWFALGWGGWFGPRRPAYLFGAAAAGFGAMTLADPAWGHLVALLTIAATVAVAVGFRDPVLLGIGTVAALVTLPRTISRFFPGTIAAPVVLLIVGLLLVVLALALARRPSGVPRQQRRAYVEGPPDLALAIASGVVVVTAATIVLVAAG